MVFYKVHSVRRLLVLFIRRHCQQGTQFKFFEFLDSEPFITISRLEFDRISFVNHVDVYFNLRFPVSCFFLFLETKLRSIESDESLELNVFFVEFVSLSDEHAGKAVPL